MPTLVSNPIVWSARILQKLDKTFVYGAAFTNRNYEGEIKDAGSTVRILQVGPINVSDYTGTLAAPQELDTTALDLVVDQRKYFNFVVDDVDDQFSAIKLIDEGSGQAGIAMSDVRDQYVASFHSAVNVANTDGDDTTPIVVGFGNGQVRPYDAFLNLSQKLDEANVGSMNRRVVLPPWFVRALKTQFGDKATSLGDNITENGMAGNVDGVMIYQSNNVANVAGAKYKVMMGLPVITFADAIVKTETFRPEAKFGTAVKGLHVFGGKLLQAKALSVGTYSKGQLYK